MDQRSESFRLPFSAGPAAHCGFTTIRPGPHLWLRYRQFVVVGFHDASRLLRHRLILSTIDQLRGCNPRYAKVRL